MVSLVTFFIATWSFVGCAVALVICYDIYRRR